MSKVQNPMKEQYLRLSYLLFKFLPLVLLSPFYFAQLPIKVIDELISNPLQGVEIFTEKLYQPLLELDGAEESK